MFSQICEQQKTSVVGNCSSEMLSTSVSVKNETIVDDLFLELDSHVELDRKLPLS